MTKIQILNIAPAKENFLTELQQIEIDRIYGGSNIFQFKSAIHSLNLSDRVAENITTQFATAFAQTRSDVPNNPFHTIQSTENNMTDFNLDSQILDDVSRKFIMLDRKSIYNFFDSIEKTK